MAGSRPSKNPLPSTDTLSVDISHWVHSGAIAENITLKQVVEQQQQELTDKTQAQEQLVKKTRLLEKKLDEEVERARVVKRKLDAAEAKLVEKENTAQALRKDLEGSQAAVVAANRAHEEAALETSALSEQLDATKAELSSARVALGVSKILGQTELDAAKSECAELRKALETAKAETVAKQSQISKLSEVNDQEAADRQVLAQEYARLKGFFDTFGQLCMPRGREVIAGGVQENNVVAGTSPVASRSAEAVDNSLIVGEKDKNAVAGPSSPIDRAPSKRKHDDDEDDEEDEDEAEILVHPLELSQPGVDVRVRGGLLRPATRRAKRNRPGSTTDEETGKTVGANVPLVPLPTTPARNDPPTFKSSRNSARTKRQPSVNKDPLVEISLDNNTDETDSKPDIATKTLLPYDPDDLDDICLMPTPDSYGVERLPPEWSSPSDRKTPRRTSAHTKRLRDIPSSGSAKKRTLRMRFAAGNARGAVQGDNDDDDDPINL